MSSAAIIAVSRSALLRRIQVVAVLLTLTSAGALFYFEVWAAGAAACLLMTGLWRTGSFGIGTVGTVGTLRLLPDGSCELGTESGWASAKLRWTFSGYGLTVLRFSIHPPVTLILAADALDQSGHRQLERWLRRWAERVGVAANSTPAPAS